MSEINQPLDAHDVYRAAGDWIARLQADDLSEEDHLQFEQWHAAHPLHARVYGEMLGTWNEFRSLGVAGDVSTTDVTGDVGAVGGAGAGAGAGAGGVGGAWAGGVGEAGWATMARRGPRRWFPRLAAAAVLLLVVGVGYLLLPAPDAVYTSALGEHVSVPLADGSRLDLNTDSVARVRYSRRERTVRIERGEAYFEVAPDPSRPFSVFGGGSWVHAMGTEFDVYLRPAGMQVTVTEGKVKIDTTPTAYLVAGQQIDISRSTAVLKTLSAAELGSHTAWRSGMLHFDARPLGEVVDELNRYTSVKMRVSKPALRQRPVGGSFEASPRGAQTLLSLLHNGLGLHVQTTGDQVTID